MNELIKENHIQWLGYGQIDSPFWFLGIEEGGAEIIWDDGEQAKSRGKLKIAESFLIREKFKPVEDFYNVWRVNYGFDLKELQRRPTTWRYIASFLLALNGQKNTREEVRQFIWCDEQFGVENVGKYPHFLGEFYPLPKRSLDDWPEHYTSFYPSQNEYKAAMKEKRLNMFVDQIEKSQTLKLIICYKKDILKILEESDHTKIEPALEDKSFSLFNLRIKSKEIKLLITPFFGNGQISYSRIAHVAKELLDKKYI